MFHSWSKDFQNSEGLGTGSGRASVTGAIVAGAEFCRGRGIDFELLLEDDIDKAELDASFLLCPACETIGEGAIGSTGAAAAGIA